jgi:hypothetical protein
LRFDQKTFFLPKNFFDQNFESYKFGQKTFLTKPVRFGQTWSGLVK